MFQYLGVVCLLAIVSVSCGNPIGNEVVDDQQLVLAFVINRHGERTPDSDELSLSNEQEKLRNLTAIEGLEGLTNVAMAALYPPEAEQQWDEGVGKVWQPVPYTAVPLSEDYLRYYSNCAPFTALMKAAKQQSVLQEFRQFDDLIPKLKALTGRNFTEDPLLFETLFDLMRSQVGLGLDIPEWAKPLLPRLGEAARLAYRLYFRTDEMKKIGGGVLLNNFIEAATAISKGKSVSKRLRLFSAHDFNIGALMEVARVRGDQSIPEYGAVFALELYKSRSTGELGVLVILSSVITLIWKLVFSSGS
ncbi:hypothetical protein ABMA27_003432 [Loxostege sticticalis]|uniref:acid phosphatase n=1 Tax=Loxostege sticticalis TaxID=481309 RepID=A0ABR3HT28_LOXSC